MLRWSLPLAAASHAPLELVGAVTLATFSHEPASQTWCGIKVRTSPRGNLDSHKGFVDYAVNEPDTLTAARYVTASCKTPVVLDIGAWRGPFAVFALALGASVVAVEPTTKAFRELVLHMAAQPAEMSRRIAAVRAAVGRSSDGPFQMITDVGSQVDVLCDPNNPGSGRSYRHSCEVWRQGGDANTATVRVLSAEDLEREVPSLTRVSLVKMDVEGYERVLAASLQGFLRRTRAAAIVALHPSYLGDDVESGRASIRKVVASLQSTFPFLYMTSASRHGRKPALPSLLSSPFNASCHHFEGCQVLGLWTQLDASLWRSLLC